MVYLRRNEDVGKKVLSVLMSAFLVAQMYFTPLQTAYAASGVAAGEVLTQEQAAADNDTDSQDLAADSNSDGEKAVDDAEQAVDEQADDEQADENNVDEPVSDEQSDEPAANDEDNADEQPADTLSVENNALVLADALGATGTYNPDDAPVAIDATSGTINATLSYDEEGAHQYDGEAIEADDSLYATVNVVFNTDKKPTLEHPNVSYALPDTIDVADRASSDLLDSKGNKAGTWEISGNKVVLKFSDTWLNAQTSEISANFKFNFTLSNKSQGDGSSTSITFPGTSTVVRIPTKDGSVTGSKSAANYDAEDNSYTWTITIKPATYATNVVVNDEIGSNLAFTLGCFYLIDNDNNKINVDDSAVYGVSITGNQAIFKLGNLEAGTYKIVYKTGVSESALKDLTDGKTLSDVDNKCSWSWGSTTRQTSQEVKVTPQAIKYSMVNKSASGTNSDITWTVKLNTGTLKADMSNYTFTDTLGDGHHFIAGTQYEVKDANNQTIATGNVDASSKTLTFSLPNDVGTQSLTVTYHTAMDSATSLNPVKNTAKVTPNGDGVTGEGEGTYTPTDTATYVEKTLDSRSDDGATATWTSTIKFQSMAADTDASKIQWVDTISRSTWASFTFSELVLKAGDATLAEGDDYTVSYNDPGTCTVTFKDSATVKGLIGKTDVVVTYKMTFKSGDPIASGQKFTNTSVVNYDNVKKGEASADYSIVSVPNVIKKANSSKWDASYEWSDGTRGAWLITWEAWVNSYGSYHDSILDLGSNDVVLTDTLPDGMEYKKNSFKVRS